jgi:restriction endonuclease S subunit
METPQKFEIGQEVICIELEGWNLLEDGADDSVPPKYGEICVIESYDHFDGEWFVTISGYADLYSEEGFVPVGDISELIESLETVKDEN